MINKYLMEIILFINNAVGLYLFIRLASSILSKKFINDAIRKISFSIILIMMVFVNIKIDMFVPNIIILLAFNYYIGLTFYNGKWQIKLIISVFYVVFSIVSELITAVMFGLIFDASIIGVRENPMHLFLGGVVSRVLLILMVETVIKFSNKNASEVSLKSWLSIMSIPLVSILLSVSVVYESIVNNVFSANAVIACLAILYINIVSFYLFDHIVNQIHDNNVAKFRQKQLTLQHHQFENVISSYENVKRIRHDMLGHLITINEYLKSYQVEDGISYINKLHREIDFTKQGIFSENISVDAIVNNRISKANELGIITMIDIAIPKKINIDDMDLCVVISNLLTNAIEACQKINDDCSKHIKYIMKYKKDSIIIETKNSYDVKNIKEASGKFASSKAFRRNNELGLGLSNIESVIKKYNGIFDINRNESEFIVTLIIPDKIIA